MNKLYKTNYNKSINYGKFNQHIYDMINHTMKKLGYTNFDINVTNGKLCTYEDDFTGELYSEMSNGVITINVNYKPSRHKNFILDILSIKILNKYGFVLNII